MVWSESKVGKKRNEEDTGRNVDGGVSSRAAVSAGFNECTDTWREA